MFTAAGRHQKRACHSLSCSIHRLADLGDARYWRIDKKVRYGVLNGVARHCLQGGSVANSGAKEAKHEPLLLPIGVQAAITRCHT
jgi:hypothetical protein